MMLSTRLNKKLFVWLAAGAFLLTTAMPAVSAEDMDSDKWEFGAQVYLWGAGIDVTTQEGDEIDISFNDILSNLDMALMTTLEARKDKWALFADIIYLDVSGADTKSTGNIIGHPVKTKIEVGIEAWVVTAAGAYEVMQTETTRLDLLGGMRYLWMDLPLKIETGDGISEKVTPKGRIWDGVIGMRGNTHLNEKWYLTYYLDVGTGNSDLTWQALAGFNYKFKKLDAVFGYRYLDWDFDKKEPFDDLSISGPFAGVKFWF